MISHSNLIGKFACKDTTVKLVLPSLYGGSLEIIRTVPLILQGIEG